MRRIILPLAVLITILLSSCGGSKKDDAATLNDLRVKIEKLKKEKATSESDLKKLEADLLRMDTAAAQAAKVKLVTVMPVGAKSFEHFIDLMGRVDADNITYISPRGMGGQVKAIYVKQGQYVSKGQLVLALDNSIMMQNVQAAKQGVVTTRQAMEGVKTQLSYARNIYNRQKNLWDQGIGTEVQLITAKTNVEGLEKQLLTMEEQVKQVNESVKVAIEQLKTANVYSDVSGIADQVNIHIGETFTGMGAMGPQIKIVNKNSLKVVCNVPENYLQNIHQGTPVVINIPDAGITGRESAISLVSQSVDPNLRGFLAEAKIPSDANLKPNQTAVMRIKDYTSSNAVVIPVNMIQSDEGSKYVFVLIKSSNGKSYAHKVVVSLGKVYGETAEIIAGLNGGEQLITEGYQGLYEGQLISTDVKL